MRRAILASLGILLAMTTAASAVPVTWNVDAAGSWQTAANWSPAAIPTAVDDVVLGPIITADRTLSLDQNWTINSLTTSGSFLYTLSRGAVATNRTITLGSGNLTVGAIGLNVITTPDVAYWGNWVGVVMPNNLPGALWNIGGPTMMGPVTGAAPLSTITKTGAGILTLGHNNTYSGALTVNAGGLRLVGLTTGLGNFSMTPTVAGDVTLDGARNSGYATPLLGLAAGKTATFMGNANGNAVVSPGTAAGAIVRLRMGGAATNTVTFDNLSRYNADVSGALAGTSDSLGVTGALNLGVPGTTNSLYITPGAGSLQAGYVLANASVSVTGKFNQVYYNNILVAGPETAGSIGGTHNFVYGANYISLENPTLKPRSWLYDGATAASNSFGNAASWSALPAFDGTESVILGYVLQGGNIPRTLTLDGDRNVNDLTVVGDYTITSGTPATSKLILKSGNMKLDNLGVFYGQSPRLSGTTLQVGDGITPVTNAVWTLTSTGNTQPRQDQIGKVLGMAGTNVTVAGDYGIRFSVPNGSTYLGDWNMQTSTTSVKLVIDADNAMGRGTVTLGTASRIHFHQTEAAADIPNKLTSQAMNLNVAAASGLVVPAGGVVTLNGKLTGTSTLGIGSMNVGSGGITGTGTLLLANAANDLSGDITNRIGELRVNGGWTGAGTFNLNTGIFSGTGTVGMALNKNILVSGTAYGNGKSKVMPGTDGTIGTLTVGTPGNNNAVRFFQNTAANKAELWIDLSDVTPGLSDELDIKGVLTLGAGLGDLYLKVIDGDCLTLNGTYTLATYDSMTGTFGSVYLNSVLVSNPTNPGAFQGTHQLVYGANSLQLYTPAPIPEPGTLLLVGTGLLVALGCARRRKMT